MSLRKQSFVPGEYYHLYNRGTEKRVIFRDESDYKHFLFLMYACNTQRSIRLRDAGENFDRGETLVDVGAYCLMPNHFHILVYEKIQGGVSKYMLKLMTGYSMYFNTKYERTGKLYEGVFKSVHASKDIYLKYLYSYIHLNPAKLVEKNWKKKERTKSTTELFDYVFSYLYSSIGEYKENNFRIVSPSQFPEYFKEAIDHKVELFKWLSLNEG